MIRGPYKGVRQLDYYTGEVIDEYKTMSDAARDNLMEHCVLSHALRTQNGIMKQRKLRFEYIE